MSALDRIDRFLLKIETEDGHLAARVMLIPITTLRSVFGGFTPRIRWMAIAIVAVTTAAAVPFAILAVVMASNASNH